MNKALDSDLLRYLGHPVRLRIVECLMEEEKSVGELQELVGDIKQGRLSSHLA